MKIIELISESIISESPNSSFTFSIKNKPQKVASKQRLTEFVRNAVSPAKQNLGKAFELRS